MAYAKLSKRTLYRKSNAGELTVFRLGGLTYWSKPELDSLVRATSLARPELVGKPVIRTVPRPATRRQPASGDAL